MTTTAPPPSILGIVGSLRADSHNARLLERLVGPLADHGLTVNIRRDLVELPLFNEDLERDPPDRVVEFTDALAAADGIVLASPEYNFSIPGVLKNALDWASRHPRPGRLAGVPVGIVGASIGAGAARQAHAHLRAVLSALGAPTFNGAHLSIGFAAAELDSDVTTRAVTSFATRFSEFVERNPR